MNNRLTARDRDYILNLHKAGCTVREIAHLAFKSHDQVRTVLKTAGVVLAKGRKAEKIEAAGEPGSFWGGDQ